MKPRVPLTPSQIFEIWKLRKQNPPVQYKKISDDLGIVYHSVADTDRRLDKYIHQPEKVLKVNANFKKAAEIAKEYLAESNPKEEEIKVEDYLESKNSPPKFSLNTQPGEGLPRKYSHYEALSYALETFKGAVEDFIEEEMKDIREENRKLDEENSKLKILVGQARHSNWGASLAAKFNK